MDAETKRDLQSLLEKGKTQPLTSWLAMERLMIAKSLAWKSTIAPVSMLVHPTNRNGLQLNPHEVHSKGVALLKMGLDPEKLRGQAVCTEISQDPATNQKQLAYNAHGSTLLAKPGGMERYCSLSCSHTTQFLKAIALNCETNEEELPDKSGRLRLDSIMKNSVCISPYSSFMHCVTCMSVHVTFTLFFNTSSLSNLAMRAWLAFAFSYDFLFIQACMFMYTCVVLSNHVCLIACC